MEQPLHGYFKLFMLCSPLITIMCYPLIIITNMKTNQNQHFEEETIHLEWNMVDCR